MPANPSDVCSIDAIIAAAYDGISGRVGEKRDWQRERSLFIPGARLIPTSGPADAAPPPAASVRQPNLSGVGPQLLDIDGFIARVEPYFEKNGFYEKEIARRVERFGNIAHVWSTYESRHDPSDPEPFMRGINSIQLFNDGKRWWIVSLYWQHEDSEHPIPKEYLRCSGSL